MVANKTMFKKRQQKGAGLRKSREVDLKGTGGEDEDDLDLEQIRLINELRGEQKDRHRTTGINSNKLMSASAEAVSKREKEKEQEKLGVQEQVGSNLKAIMTNQFTEQVGSAQTDDQAHLKRMEAYIDEKMGVIQENIPAKVITEEDKLFEIAQVAKNSTTDEGSIGVAAPLFMNTGLAEVNLPISFKMKNIQRTEEAKTELGYKRSSKTHLKTFIDNTVDAQPTGSGRYGGAAAATGGSFNSNFNTHRREYAAILKNEKRGPSGAERTTEGRSGESGGRSATSDDRAFDQYRKHARR